MDLEVYLGKIRREIEKSPLNKYAELVHSKTGISPEVIVILIFIILAFMLFFDIFADLICDIIVLIYPLYASIKVIELNDKTKEIQWLTYWIILGIFGSVETFVHIIVYWIPFYYPLKASFLIWCMHPKFNGAETIYSNFLIHHVKKYFKKEETNPKTNSTTTTPTTTSNSTTTTTTQSVASEEVSNID